MEEERLTELTQFFLELDFIRKFIDGPRRFRSLTKVWSSRSISVNTYTYTRIYTQIYTGIYMYIYLYYIFFLIKCNEFLKFQIFSKNLEQHFPCASPWTIYLRITWEDFFKNIDSGIVVPPDNLTQWDMRICILNLLTRSFHAWLYSITVWCSIFDLS